MDEMADHLLRMPPQPPQREERGQFISKDEQLQDFDECNYVFTDIAVGHNDEVCVLLESFVFSSVSRPTNCSITLVSRSQTSFFF